MDEWSFMTGKLYILSEQGGLWLGMTGGLNTNLIGVFRSRQMRQEVFERRVVKIQGPLKTD